MCVMNDMLHIKVFNNDLLVTIDEQVFELKELQRNKTYSKKFDHKKRKRGKENN